MTELLPAKELKLVIYVPPRTKKNHQNIVINRKTGRMMVVQSKQCQEYEREAGRYIPEVETISRPVNVRGLFYMPTKRRVDLVNLQEALLDVLVKYKVLEDDNCTIVVSMDGSRVLYDKECPRTEVIIEYMED